MKLAQALALGAGGIALGVGGWALITLQEIKTGLPNLDALRAPLLAALAGHGLLLPQHGRAMMAIFQEEHGRKNGGDVDPIGSGDPNFDPLSLGDLTLPGGPSIGPGQVYFKTAYQLGLWDQNDRDGFIAYGSDPNNLWGLINMAVAVYKVKLKIANGDVPTAIKLYNGAQSYEDNALAFESQVFGTDGQS